MNTGASKSLVVVMLLLATALVTMSTDLYTPSMPHLPALLDTDPATVQLTMALNVAAFGLAQLWYGPLADRIGRRPVYVTCIALFTLFSLACAAASTIGQLIIARTLQGAAAAAEAVLVLAMLTDLFNARERVKIMAIYGVLFAIAPGVAPILGGYLHVEFGWRSNFLLLALLGLVLWVGAWRWLPETHPGKDQGESSGAIGDYFRLLRHWPFLSLCLSMATVTGLFYAFLVEAPFVVINHYGVRTEHFGYFQLVVVLVYMAGGLLVTRLVKHVEPWKMLFWSVVATAVGVFVLVLTQLSGMGLYAFTASIALLMFVSAPLWAVIPSLAMTASVTGAGTAAAMFGAVEMLGGGGAVLLASSLHDGSPLALVQTCCACLLALCLFAGLAGVARH